MQNAHKGTDSRLTVTQVSPPSRRTYCTDKAGGAKKLTFIIKNMAFYDLAGTGPGMAVVYGTNFDDEAIGSSNSMLAYMYGGNDSVAVFGGFDNLVNGNWGDDNVSVFYENPTSGSGGAFYGSKGSDNLTVVKGRVELINGNKGDDLVTGFSGVHGTFRGSQGNDVMDVVNGLVYGDKGSDTFVLTRSGSASEYSHIVDYTPFVDQIAYQPSDGILIFKSTNEGLWLGQVGGTYTMLLSGIYDINQVTLSI